MGPVIGLILFVVALAQSEDPNCDGIIIRGIKYEEEVLKEGGGLFRPYQLSVDYSNNTVYFAVIADIQPDDKDSTVLFPACIDLNTGEYAVIPGLQATTATAVDNKNHIVYLGSSYGLHTYDRSTKEVKRISELGGDIIWSMFFKDSLYYTVIESSTPFVYKDGMSKKLTEVELAGKHADLIGVDKKDNIWVETEEKELFYYIKEENKTISVGNYEVNGFTLDTEENMYFSNEDGIYAIDDDRNIELMFEKNNLQGVAFDADNNIIYSDDERIVRLKRTSVKCPSQ